MRHFAVLALLFVRTGPLAAQQPPRPLPDFSAAKRADNSNGKTPSHLQPIQMSAARGLEWLQRANQPDGKFLSGFNPALAAKIDNDAFLAQTEAALALLRAARFERD